MAIGTEGGSIAATGTQLKQLLGTMAKGKLMPHERSDKVLLDPHQDSVNVNLTSFVDNPVVLNSGDPTIHVNPDSTFHQAAPTHVLLGYLAVGPLKELGLGRAAADLGREQAMLGAQEG